MIKAMLEAGIIDLNKTANGTMARRMLADDEAVTISYLEDTDPQIANAVDAGLDSQIDETEVADVAVEIDQSEPTEALDAISNVSDDD